MSNKITTISSLSMTTSLQSRLHYFRIFLVIAVFIFLGLSGWQLYRGYTKAALQHNLQDQQVRELTASDLKDPTLLGHKVRVTGRVGTPFVFWGMPQQGVQGYRVWVPLEHAHLGCQLWVELGWVPDFNQLPHVVLGQTLEGYLWQPQGFPFIQPSLDKNTHGYVMQNFSEPLLSSLTRQPMCSAIVRLTTPVPGFRRILFENYLTPERHYGYALTWFLLALVALFYRVKLFA